MALVSACAMPEPPGELVGAYRIEGTLLENTCGSTAVPAADPLRFDVELRSDGDTGLWVRVPPPRSGRLDDDGAFRFELQSSFATRSEPNEPAETLTEMQIEALADPDGYQRLDQPAAQRCRLLVTELIHGTVLHDGRNDDGATPFRDEPDAPADDADDEVDLVGENEISIRAAPGTDCSLVLEAQGGPFLALPCRIDYALEGQLIE
jgi:hypothetical protein